MSWQNDFIKYAENYSPNEACGLFAIIEGKEKFWPCKNLAESKHQFFIIDPDDWASCEDAGEILGVVHSHPVGDSTPSDADKASCEHLGFPYYIYSVKHKSWNKLEPSGWKTPSLIGRKWIWGKHDCWSVISDWYYETKNIKLIEWKRPKTIKEHAKNPEFEKALPILGFKKYSSTSKLETGDVLLFEGRKDSYNHAALYLGDMIILHHSINKLSCREVFNLSHQKQLRGIYRYEP